MESQYDKLTLKHPVQFGSELVKELTFKPTARAFKGFTQSVNSSGGVLWNPFDLASVAVRLAGYPDVVAEMLHPEDMNRLTEVASHFLQLGL